MSRDNASFVNAQEAVGTHKRHKLQTGPVRRSLLDFSRTRDYRFRVQSRTSAKKGLGQGCIDRG